MKFISFKGINNNDGLFLVKEILNIVLEDDKNLENLKLIADIKKSSHYSKIIDIFLQRLNKQQYPISAYTPKRLSIALEKYKKDFY